jgi:hypothetical protein
MEELHERLTGGNELFVSFSSASARSDARIVRVMLGRFERSRPLRDSKRFGSEPFVSRNQSINRVCLSTTASRLRPTE